MICSAHRLRRNVQRGTLVLDELPDAIGIVGLISQLDCALAEMVEQGIVDLPVVRLSGGKPGLDGKALRVDSDVVFGRELATSSAETSIQASASCRRRLLVRLGGGVFDHLNSAIVRGIGRVYSSLPSARTPSSHEAIVAGGAWAIALRQVSPGRTGSPHAEKTVQHATVIDAGSTSQLGGKDVWRSSGGTSSIFVSLGACETRPDAVVQRPSDQAIASAPAGKIIGQPGSVAARKTALATSCDVVTSPLAPRCCIAAIVCRAKSA